MSFDTAYTPYGEAYATSGTAKQDFTGDLQDIFTGMFDTPNRELVTTASRWLSPDPAGANWNAYAYPTDPNRQTDPTGLDGQSPCAAWGSCELANDHISPLMNRFFVPDSTKYGTDGRPAPWLPAQNTGQLQADGSCGFWCRVFHRDRVPAKFVILYDKTQNKGSYSIFYYQLKNNEGQKLTGNGYDVEEHISPSAGSTTSEGTFVPADNGVSQDLVGMSRLDANGQRQSVTLPTSPNADFIVEQTFTVKYEGTEYNLTTIFEHETVIVNGSVTNTVTDIVP